MSTPTHPDPPGTDVLHQRRSGPAGRRRRAGIPGRSRAGSGTTRTARPRPAGRRPAGAAARAGCAAPAGGGAGAGRGPRSPGSGRRRAPTTRPAPTTRSSISSGSSTTESTGGSSSASGRRTTIPSSLQMACTSSRGGRAPSARWPAPTARAPARRTARGRHTRQSPELVAEALDHDLAVGGEHAAGRLPLLLDVGEQVAHRQLVEAALGVQPGLVPRARRHLADERAHGPAELVRAPDLVPVPERHLARHARRRGHDHPVAGDVLDPPRGGAEQEGLARPGSRRPSPRRARRPGCPSGVNTPKGPRSGIVPPLVTASILAPGRGSRAVPASRSHVTRGRSSANSSDGYRPESMSSTPSRTAVVQSANG